MNELISAVPILLGVVGVLAFITSIIIGVIKGLPGLNKIPTDILVFVVAIIATLITVFAYTDYIAHTVVWYEVVGAIVGGLVVAFIAMFGWEKFYELWDRFRNKGGDS